MEFKKLFDINIWHDYYGGHCTDVLCVPVCVDSKVSNQALMKHKTLRGLSSDGQYSAFFETNGTEPIKSIAGKTLYFAIIATNSSFARITSISNSSDTVSVYRNQQASNTLGAPVQYIPIGSRYTYSITSIERPVTVSLVNQNDDLIAQHIINEDNGLNELTFLFAAHEEGLFKITEQSASNSKSSNIAYLPDLPDRCVGLVQITIDSSFYQQAASFDIQFTAKFETLNYYILTSNYDSNDVQGLSMNDAGFNEQSRNQLLFNKLQSSEFTNQHIAPHLLQNNNANVVLFTSQSALARRKQGPKKLQLVLNNEVLIPNLPTPGSSSLSADFFIHVAKP